MHSDGVKETGLLGHRFGRFTVLAELASGGMGRVYLARSPGGRIVAVKTLLADGAGEAVPEVDRRRFAREVALAQRVRGVYTAGVVDADASAPMPWMATEYIAAPSLRDLVARCGTLEADALHWIAAGIAEALVDVHAAGLVHRDVKPSNVLLPIEGPRVIDFGISQAGDVTRTQAVLGTVAFAAPEQAQGGPTTAASDVFSLGATLFHLAVGRAPYRDGGVGPAVEQLVRAATGDLDVSGLPPELTSLVLPCLALDPALRPTPAQILELCAERLRLRPEARGGEDWLDPGWSAEINRYRERRSREVEQAGRRADPDAVTDRIAPPAQGQHQGHPRPTSPLTTPWPPSPPGAGGPVRPVPPTGQRGRRKWWTAGAGVLALTLAGALLVIRPWEEETGTATLADPVGFYPVTQRVAGSCGSGQTPADPTAADTAAGAGRESSYTDPDSRECVTVSGTGGMTVSKLDDVRAVFGPETGGWQVEITFAKEDAPKFTALTGRIAGLPTPRNSLALVQDDRVLASPAVMDRVRGQEVTINSGLTKDKAETLAKALGGR